MRFILLGTLLVLSFVLTPNADAQSQSVEVAGIVFMVAANGALFTASSRRCAYLPSPIPRIRPVPDRCAFRP